MRKRFFLCLLVLSLLVTVLPVNAATPEHLEEYIILEQPQKSYRSLSQYADFDQIVPKVRAQLTALDTTIQYTFWVEDRPEIAVYPKQVCRELFYTAMAHTGVSNQGDYIFRSTYDGYKVSIAYFSQNGRLYLEATYTVYYKTTPQQEAAVDAGVDQLLNQLELNGKTDYQKLCAIYNYMTEHIYYDTGLNDSTDKLRYTAYGALIENSAVCQGYASLLYRLCLECGIDCRIISGISNGGGHAWNIVRLGDRYYNADVTWDSTRLHANLSYEYFLRSQDTFDDHVRDADFSTPAFLAEYPMDYEDYNPNTPSIGDMNIDGVVNILDVMQIINCITGSTLFTPSQQTLADINDDHTINILDVMALINEITGA